MIAQKEYKVIIASTPEALAERVTQEMQEGFNPVGSLVIQYPTSPPGWDNKDERRFVSPGSLAFLQPMARWVFTKGQA